MAERSLGQRRDFQALVDRLAGVAIWIVSTPGEFEYVSDGFEEIFGVPAETMTEDPSRLLERIHPDDRERVLEAMAQEEDEMREASYENRVVRPDGTVRWVQTRQFPIWDEAGDFSALVGINTDITEQKRREEELEVLNRVVRHDIRNDMTVVLGWGQSLRDHVRPEGEEYLRRVLEGSQHVVELTDIARDYVETVTGREELQTEPTPLRSLVVREVTLRRESHPEATFTVAEDLPRVEVRGNELLGSVFRNLLNNAVQHNDERPPLVEVTASVDDDHVVVAVSDNGPGVPDDRKEAVFGRGTKGLDSPGTGIGLYLVRTIVEQCDGEVWVEDNEPEGAVFKVRLPLAG